MTFSTTIDNFMDKSPEIKPLCTSQETAIRFGSVVTISVEKIFVDYHIFSFSIT